MPPSTTTTASLSCDGPGLPSSHRGAATSGLNPAMSADTRDAAVDACHVGVLTDPDCLGPCEPGTTVTLEGIVWNETENGMKRSLLQY